MTGISLAETCEQARNFNWPTAVILLGFLAAIVSVAWFGFSYLKTQGTRYEITFPLEDGDYVIDDDDYDRKPRDN